MGARLFAGTIGAIGSAHLPAGSERAAIGRCSPRCCKTPHGHSTVRDTFPSWHAQACHCHDIPTPPPAPLTPCPGQCDEDTCTLCDSDDTDLWCPDCRLYGTDDGEIPE